MFVPPNRCVEYFAKMVDQESAAVAAKPDADDTPPSEFARRFRRQMTYSGMDKPMLVEAVNKLNVLKKPITDRQIQNFISSKVDDAEKIRNAPELAACAAAMACNVRNFFEDGPTSIASAPDDMHKMLDVALAGPKSGFLKEALQFAFTQAVLAKTHV